LGLAVAKAGVIAKLGSQLGKGDFQATMSFWRPSSPIIRAERRYLLRI
jgi:hypothetical protein